MVLILLIIYTNNIFILFNVYLKKRLLLSRCHTMYYSRAVMQQCTIYESVLCLLQNNYQLIVPNRENIRNNHPFRNQSCGNIAYDELLNKSTSLFPKFKTRSSLHSSQESIEESFKFDNRTSSQDSSCVSLNVSRTSSFLEGNVIGRLNIGWQDEPDIVAVFLSGQLDKLKSNISFYDDDHSSMFLVPNFELRTSPMFSTNAPIVKPSAEGDHNSCNFMTSTQVLDLPMQKVSNDVKNLTKSNINLSDLKEKVHANMEEILNKQLEMSQTCQMADTACSNSPDVQDGLSNNMFSTTIISAPQVGDAGARISDCSLTIDLDNVNDGSPHSPKSYSSPYQTASTPTKASPERNHQEYTFQTPSQINPLDLITPADLRRPTQSSANTGTFNPFDSCAETFLLPTVSPSLFKEVISPNAARETDPGNFRWSIEQMALLNPASIEMPSHHSSVDTPKDPDYERKVQDAIDKYFSRCCVLPSPWTTNLARSTTKKDDLLSKYSLPTNPNFTPRLPSGNRNRVYSGPAKCKQANQSASSKSSVACQTSLSFPSLLPPALEAALAPYMNVQQMHKTRDDRSVENSFSFGNTSLRRRLLFSNEEMSSCSPSLNIYSQSKSQTPQYPEIVHVDSPVLSTPDRSTIKQSPLLIKSCLEETSPIVSSIHPGFCDSSTSEAFDNAKVRHSFSSIPGCFISPKFDTLSPIKSERDPQQPCSSITYGSSLRAGFLKSKNSSNTPLKGLIGPLHSWSPSPSNISQASPLFRLPIHQHLSPELSPIALQAYQSDGQQMDFSVVSFNGQNDDSDANTTLIHITGEHVDGIHSNSTLNSPEVMTQSINSSTSTVVPLGSFPSNSSVCNSNSSSHTPANFTETTTNSAEDNKRIPHCAADAIPMSVAMDGDPCTSDVSELRCGDLSVSMCGAASSSHNTALGNQSFHASSIMYETSSTLLSQKWSKNNVDENMDVDLSQPSLQDESGPDDSPYDEFVAMENINEHTTPLKTHVLVRYFQ